MAKRFCFYGGVFLLCMSVLALQVIQTRLLSVAGYYHLAFFAISMAMLGLTAGAVRVYLRCESLAKESLSLHLTWTASAFAISTAVCLGFQLASVAVLVPWATSIFVWAKLALLLAPPFFFSGMAISLALTRSPFPMGRVYGVDLAGAATGCLASIAILDTVDGPSAILLVAASGAMAAVLFARAGLGSTPDRYAGAWWFLHRPMWLAMALFAVAGLNAWTPYGLQPVSSKEEFEDRSSFAYEKWNSFSRVVASEPANHFPSLWGRSSKTPEDFRVDESWLSIDGSAGTAMPRFDGDMKHYQFLRYDITNLGYAIRDGGRAAIIGVGGGRDVLSAYYFGFRDITGVELNPIFIDLLTRNERFRKFSGLSSLPGVKFAVDDARSWFARTDERFNFIQMSMVDTWASTGAGGFTLSENGLYTVEGWGRFLKALTADGVFTVSRWYGASKEEEVGRLISLAMAALFASGKENPRSHIFLAGQSRLATIVVGARPLTPEEIARLTEAAARLDYKVLLSPAEPPASVMFGDIVGAMSIKDLVARGAKYTLDLSPPTDARPFFFNQLRLYPAHLWAALRSGAPGVLRGNIVASGTLLLIILLSAAFVAAVIVIPLRSTVRAVGGRLVRFGTAYFVLIGLGFMLVEIGLIQRISVFLGHPTYALSIGLFSIILSTGFGSFWSDRAPLNSFTRFGVWAVVLGAYLIALPIWLSGLLMAFESSGIVTRALVCLGAIAPAGLLMGFGFPTGMALVTGVDPRPTPWLWGVNGAAGVLSASLAVACSITFSINWTLFAGGVCYLLLIPTAAALFAVSGPPRARWQRRREPSGSLELPQTVDPSVIGASDAVGRLHGDP